MQEPNNVRELLKEFDTAMLVTHLPSGHLHSRPMAIAQTGAGGDLWFATRIDSPKVDEIQGDHDVNVTCQKEDRFLSLSGTAELVQDREALDRLWDEAWRAWFPEGKDSEKLALIHVIPHEAEYWAHAGGDKVRMHFQPGMPLERRSVEGESTGQAPGTA